MYFKWKKVYKTLFSMIFFVDSIPCPLAFPNLLSSTSHRMESVLPQVLSTSFLESPNHKQQEGTVVRGSHLLISVNVHGQTILIGNKTVVFFFDELGGCNANISLHLPPKLISLWE